MKKKDLIADWRTQKTLNKKKRQKFVTNLRRKKGKKLDELGDNLHEEVFQEIDCLDCANCCTSIPPMLLRADVTRISKYLGMKTTQFEAEYLIEDEDGDMVMNSTPCPFLEEDNKCFIYEHRPKACRKYPHTDEMEFSRNLRLHAVNVNHCPAVFHILERMMAL
ncbi:MAG: YkgJ family cysteine cluster protein [Chitinophagales bacterium]